MVSEGLTSPRSAPPRTEDAKAYNRIKLATGITSSLLSFALLLLLVATTAGKSLAALCLSACAQPYGALLLFASAVGIMQSALTLPLSWYSGFHLEHRFGLSNQSPLRWALERLKGLSVALPLAAGVFCILYFCLGRFGGFWWLPVGTALTLLSVALARVAPVLLMPLFYRFTPIADGSLKERIVGLCERAGVRVEGVFSFNLSKNTKKANAAFTGIGRSRRIILGDTLIRGFSEDEIETVFAHELGHYRFGHIRTGMIAGAVSTFAGLYVAARLYEASIATLHFSSPTDLAALPLLAIWLGLFGLLTSPLGNMISRHHERQADAYAVRTTGKRDAFASALRKLSATNLADPSPHPLVEFMFYSHPPVAKRIRALDTGNS
ncbi:MAG TPA: M48 family metallopeptidase [Bacteroidota bacterium]|nr:M48 family metallopeptidase [Bacteroidota bacterium]